MKTPAKKQKKISRRSQMEIMGLMIIVVILSLALLFVIKAVFLKKPQETTQSYETSKLVSSFVGTLLQTTSDCTGDTTLQDLLIDCAKNPGGSITCSNGEDSCNYANETIATILDQTVSIWGDASGYEFIAVAPPNHKIIYYSSGNLSASTDGETTPYPLRLYPSQQDLYVYLCIGGCGSNI